MVVRSGDTPVTTPESERLSTAVSAPNRPVAVLDLGASAIRLLVAELPPGGTPRILEEASRGVLLGKDTFGGGRLGAPTIEATLQALEGFRRIMDGYGVVRYRAVATSAVREATEPRHLPRPRAPAHRDRRRGDRRLRGEPPDLSRRARGAPRARGADGRRRAAGRGGRRQRRHLVPAPRRAGPLGHLPARRDPHAPEPRVLARQPRAAHAAAAPAHPQRRRRHPARDAAARGAPLHRARRRRALRRGPGAGHRARRTRLRGVPRERVPLVLRPDRWRTTSSSWSRRTACRSPRPRRWCPRCWPTASCCSRPRPRRCSCRRRRCARGCCSTCCARRRGRRASRTSARQVLA